MRNLIYGLLFATTACFFTACFDITEVVTIAKNGSGSYVQTIDAAKMSEQLAFFASMDTTGQMIPQLKSGIDSSLRENWNKYKDVKGVSKLTIDNPKDFVYKVSFEFENIAALNAALNLDKKEDKDKDVFAWSKGKLSRKNVDFDLKGLGMDDKDGQMEMIKPMMSEAAYTLIFNLPNAVKSVSNATAKISEDKKIVTQKVSMLDLMEGKAKLGTEIEYKK